MDKVPATAQVPGRLATEAEVGAAKMAEEAAPGTGPGCYTCGMAMEWATLAATA